MNYLLSNDEAELGINPNSEDLDLEEDDGLSVVVNILCNYSIDV